MASYPSVITLSPPVIITAIPKYFTLTVKLTGTIMGICFNLIGGVVVVIVVFVELVELSVVLVVVFVVVLVVELSVRVVVLSVGVVVLSVVASAV